MSDDLTAQYVLTALGRGRDNARTLGDLGESLHLLRRTVEAAVQELRVEGWPVCSASDGIWLGDLADLEATIRSLRGRLVSQYQTYLALRKTARRLRAAVVDQQSLWADVA